MQTILLVDDMTEENGALEFLPRDAVSLDTSGRLVKDGGSARIDASRAVAVTGRAGDVLFFGPYAVHGSTPNQSNKPRRVLINGYAAPGANKRVYPRPRRVPRAAGSRRGGVERTAPPAHSRVTFDSAGPEGLDVRVLRRRMTARIP